MQAFLLDATQHAQHHGQRCACAESARTAASPQLAGWVRRGERSEMRAHNPNPRPYKQTQLQVTHT